MAICGDLLGDEVPVCRGTSINGLPLTLTDDSYAYNIESSNNVSILHIDTSGLPGGDPTEVTFGHEDEAALFRFVIPSATSSVFVLEDENGDNYLALSTVVGVGLPKLYFGNTTTNPHFEFLGSGPVWIGGSAGTAGYVFTSNGNAAAPTWQAAGAPSGSAGGDLSGTYPNPTVTDLTIASEAQGDILYRGVSGWVRLAAGTSGHILQTNGAGADPTWVAPSGGGGASLDAASAVTVGTTLSTSVSIGRSGGGALNLTGAAASTWAVTGGALVVQTTSQALTVQTVTSGTLAVTSAGALNLTGAAASTHSYTGGAFILQATSQALTVRTVTSGALSVTAADALTMTGGATSVWSLSSGALTIRSGSSGAFVLAGNQSAASSSVDVQVESTATRTAGVLLRVKNNTGTRVDVPFHGGIAVTQGIASSGTAPMLTLTGGAHTTQTTTTEINSVDVNPGTISWAAGAITNQRWTRFRQPTAAFASASTITKSATVAIDDAPAAGTNATLTSTYALWVVAGRTQLDGNVSIGGAGSSVGFFGATVVAQQTITAITNSVTAPGGGTLGTIPDIGTTVSTGGAAADQADVQTRLAEVQAALYRLAQVSAQHATALRNLGLGV